MKIRTRIALVMATCLILFGSFALIINEVAFRNVKYPSESLFQNELMRSIGVDRETVIQSLRAHPELLFTPTTNAKGPTGVSVDAAAREIQRRTIQRAVAQSQRWTLLALILVAFGAVTTGWLLAGRILQPVRLLTKRARSASELDLASRVSLQGPNDEMKGLADTFDGMLDRIAVAFEAQRRFSAQVSHELRTPLSVTRSEVELMLADSGDDTSRRHLETIVDATDRAERLVSQLLILSRTDSRDLDRTSFSFDELVGNVVGRAVERPSWSGVRVELNLHDATVVGDRALLESLVQNLVDNAARHNVSEGWAAISVGPSGDGRRAVLSVSNSAEPVRGAVTPIPGEPHIGLTIVEAVVEAHQGSLEWRRDEDVVVARVELPAVVEPEARVAGHLLTHASR